MSDNINSIKNLKNFSCGWISPTGDTFTCSRYNHIDLATTLCEEYKIGFGYKKIGVGTGNPSIWYNSPDDALISEGWIKVNFYGAPIVNWRKVTDITIKKLEQIRGIE